MKQWKTKNRLIVALSFGALALTFYLAACASDLKRGVKPNKGLFVEKIDLSQVYFEDAYSGELVNVADFMKDGDLEFLLLMFGSVGCSKCNEKAQLLSGEYLDKHELFLSKHDKKFDLVGVNTDSGSAQTRFRGILLNDELRLKSGYEFVRWVDPKGETMMTHLAGEGERFGVPYTVFLNRQGLLWRYTNEQSYTVKEMVERVLATLEGREVEGSTPTPEPPPPPPNVGDLPLLAFPSEYRLDEVVYRDCGSKSTGLGSTLKSHDYVFVQVDPGACDKSSHCESNFGRLRDLASFCGAKGKNCKLISLSRKALRTDFCTDKSVVHGVGGQDFLDVFATRFNWRYDAEVENDIPVRIPKIPEPVSFLFKSSGKLVGSWEGLIEQPGSASSPENIITNNLNASPKVPNFEVYGKLKSGGTATKDSLGNLLQKSKYTVVNAFDRFCGGCVDELEHWSRPGQLYDFCRERPDFCQVYAVEAELAWPNNPAGWKKLFDEITNDHFEPRGVRVPLLIDTQEYVEFSKIFGAYLTPLFPQWDGVFGIVIYDQEGKILLQFKSGDFGDHDPVFEALKKLP